jgi:tetratricopeptide (TPR) repeat protein
MLHPVLLLVALIQQPASDHALCQRLVDEENQEARTQIQSVVQAQPATPRAAFLQGCLAMADTSWDRAVGHFERALVQAPNVAAYHMWLGRVQGEQALRAGVMRKLSLARRIRDHFLRAVELEPENLGARRYLTEFYIQAPAIAGGSTARAAEQVAEIRRRSPYLGAMTAAELATRRGQHPAAEREYAALVTAYPDSVTPLIALMASYYRSKNWDAATAVTRRRQQTHPNAMLTHYLAGRTAAESGRELEAGEQALRRYLAHTPARGEPPLANAHWRLGMILQLRGDREGARSEYREALRLNPGLSEVRQALDRLR